MKCLLLQILYPHLTFFSFKGVGVEVDPLPAGTSSFFSILCNPSFPFCKHSKHLFPTNRLQMIDATLIGPIIYKIYIPLMLQSMHKSLLYRWLDSLERYLKGPNLGRIGLLSILFTVSPIFLLLKHFLLYFIFFLFWSEKKNEYQFLYYNAHLLNSESELKIR